MQDNTQELLTTIEVARRLNLSVEMIRKLARRGKLPVAIRVGRGVRLYRRADVEQLAADRRSRSDAA